MDLTHPEAPKTPCGEYKFVGSMRSAPQNVDSLTQNLDQVGLHPTHPLNMQLGYLFFSPCCVLFINPTIFLDAFSLPPIYRCSFIFIIVSYLYIICNESVSPHTSRIMDQLHPISVSVTGSDILHQIS